MVASCATMKTAIREDFWQSRVCLVARSSRLLYSESPSRAETHCAASGLCTCPLCAFQIAVICLAYPVRLNAMCWGPRRWSWYSHVAGCDVAESAEFSVAWRGRKKQRSVWKEKRLNSALWADSSPLPATRSRGREARGRPWRGMSRFLF